MSRSSRVRSLLAAFVAVLAVTAAVAFEARPTRNPPTAFAATPDPAPGGQEVVALPFQERPSEGAFEMNTPVSGRGVFIWNAELRKSPDGNDLTTYLSLEAKDPASGAWVGYMLPTFPIPYSPSVTSGAADLPFTAWPKTYRFVWETRNGLNGAVIKGQKVKFSLSLIFE